ncbi:MAG: DnaA/Hda family protein [Planctomycetaceae bacterium]|nr:DnaA/Hda family protein [Planctomycetaceae bacterium]
MKCQTQGAECSHLLCTLRSELCTLIPEPFLAGSENHLIEAAVRWALEGIPDHDRNGDSLGVVLHCPILFYGPPGCGKTHLALGIYQSWRQKNRRKHGAYLAGDDFARSLATALEAKTIDEFRNKIRKSEMLVIDGIDLLATKKAAQDELLTAIDSVIDAGRTIVLTSQRLPAQQQFPDERLLARLTAGLVVPIVLPGLSTRVALLKRFAEQLGLRLTIPANQAMAKELPVSVPQLFGTLSQLLVESGRETIDLATARIAIRQCAIATVPTIDKIAKTTAKQMGLKLTEMKAKSRKSSTVRARNIAIYLARQLTQASLKEIGKYFGGRDHTTVAHSAAEIESRIGRDSELRDLVVQIRETLQG